MPSGTSFSTDPDRTLWAYHHHSLVPPLLAAPGSIDPGGRLSELERFPATGTWAGCIGRDVTDLAEIEDVVELPVADRSDLNDLQSVARVRSRGYLQFAPADERIGEDRRRWVVL